MYEVRLDKASAVEPSQTKFSPLAVLTITSYLERVTRWKTFLLSEASQIIPKPPPDLLAKPVHGGDENGKHCVFWVPRSQVLSPDLSIPKPLSGDLCVSDLDTSSPILLPSNAVDFDPLAWLRHPKPPQTSGTVLFVVFLVSLEMDVKLTPL
ncbi:hypothetical protein P9112_006151 [Eukaryota sp. TZLM1-RC]